MNRRAVEQHLGIQRHHIRKVLTVPRHCDTRCTETSPDRAERGPSTCAMLCGAMLCYSYAMLCYAMLRYLGVERAERGPSPSLPAEAGGSPGGKAEEVL